jgi:tetratricopeptide (TPR) repeat protein
MMSFLRSSWIQILAVAVLLPVIGLLSDAANANRIALAESYEDSDLEFQGRRLKGFALGTEGMLADWYWIRSLQYIGGKIVRTNTEELNIDDLRALNPRLLYPMLDNATDLDPSFMAAYSYGAVILPAIDTQQAIQLTEKGIANNPEAWRLYHYLGYIYWRKQDYENAAQAYENGAKIAGSPSFMREMAASMRRQGGSRDTARTMYTNIRDEAGDPQTRRNAELRLIQLDALDDIDLINQTLSEFKNQNGRCANRIAEIFPMLRSRKLSSGHDLMITSNNEIADPTGVPYDFDRGGCRVGVSESSNIPKI